MNGTCICIYTVDKVRRPKPPRHRERHSATPTTIMIYSSLTSTGSHRLFTKLLPNALYLCRFGKVMDGGCGNTKRVKHTKQVDSWFYGCVEDPLHILKFHANLYKSAYKNSHKVSPLRFLRSKVSGPLEGLVRSLKIP